MSQHSSADGREVFREFRLLRECEFGIGHCLRPQCDALTEHFQTGQHGTGWRRVRGRAGELPQLGDHSIDPLRGFLVPLLLLRRQREFVTEHRNIGRDDRRILRPRRDLDLARIECIAGDRDERRVGMTRCRE